jgi:UDP-N-acetylmuramate dehydrogenase
MPCPYNNKTILSQSLMNLKIQNNISLKPFNTFGIDVNARYFIDINDIDTLQTLLTHPTWKNSPKLILGGGSNILFTKNFDGLVIKMNLKGIQKSSEDDQQIIFKVSAGENWHEFVTYCVNQNLGGIENLALIPGTVGAAPMQNIGAYGVELKSVLQNVFTLKMEDGSSALFSNQDCKLGYRDSIFKHSHKNQNIITHATFALNKNHLLHTEYGAIQSTLKTMNVENPNIRSIYDAVIKIRQSKLPDPKKMGNAGSFFKNPIVDQAAFSTLKNQYPNMPYFLEKNDHAKIPAAWLIEQCGWKGKRCDQIGVSPEHPLVLVNYGGGSGESIKQLADDISESVFQKFSVVLPMEVNVV